MQAKLNSVLHWQWSHQPSIQKAAPEDRQTFLFFTWLEIDFSVSENIDVNLQLLLNSLKRIDWKLKGRSLSFFCTAWGDITELWLQWIQTNYYEPFRFFLCALGANISVPGNHRKNNDNILKNNMLYKVRFSSTKFWEVNRCFKL